MVLFSAFREEEKKQINPEKDDVSVSAACGQEQVPRAPGCAGPAWPCIGLSDLSLGLYIRFGIWVWGSCGEGRLKVTVLEQDCKG